MIFGKNVRLLWIVIAIVLMVTAAYWLCPKPELKVFTTYSSAIFDSHSQLLRITLSDDEKYRIYESIENISPNLLDATVLYEDKDFYNNYGVDFIALVRAFWTTYFLQERRVGASTISMQVARLRWNIPSNTVVGKAWQILRALQLSRHYSKKELLEFYVNFAPYGRNIEGITAASLIYFNKKPSELSLIESLTLAVIPQNPNKRTPTSVKGYQELLYARNSLFDRWVVQKPLDERFRKYLDMPLQVRPPEELSFEALHFVNYVMDSRSRWSHGIINSTLDLRLQNKIEKLASDFVSSRVNEGINNVSALLIDYRKMEIKAMVGSADFFNNKIQGQVNGVIAKRSPGSTLKPFVYAMAMDQGLIHPMSLLKDSPRRFGGFTPENYDKQFMGPILARDALIQSRNVPAVDLQSQLGEQSFYDFLIKAGVTDLKDEEFYGLALALGGGEVTMLELVKLYAMLANKGVLRELSAINVDDSSILPKETRMLSPESSYLILDILKDNPAPDELGVDLRYLEKSEIAWKTGTSWAFRDAWSVGISGPYVLAVWVGNFNGEGNGSFIGRTAAGPLLFSIFEAINKNKGWKVSDLLADDNLNLKRIEVCSKTGDLQDKNCPSFSETWFIPGVSPIKVSNIYRKIPVDEKSNLRTCKHIPGKTVLKVYEFWPSDFLHIFNQAGISLKTPPPYEADCSLDQKSSVGQAPVITSPQISLEYVIRSDAEDSRLIPFMATVDSDVDEVYWFVNGKFVGQAKRGQSFIWHASSGIYEIRAVDDAGRGASKTIKVIQYN